MTLGGTCPSELATLRADTLAASSSFTNSKSVTSLVGKLDAASTKLSQGKNADAVQKRPTSRPP